MGTYAISQGTLSAGSNYTLNYTGANFSITQALLSVTANPLSKVYGSADPALTYGVSGLVNGDTSAVFSGALSRASGENVGSYAISQGTLSAGGNYTIAFTGASFAITPSNPHPRRKFHQSRLWWYEPDVRRNGNWPRERRHARFGHDRRAELRQSGDRVQQCRVLCHQRCGPDPANNGNDVFAQAAAMRPRYHQSGDADLCGERGQHHGRSQDPDFERNGDRLRERRHTGECNGRDARLHNYSDKVESPRCLRDRRFRAVCGQRTSSSRIRATQWL